MTLPTVHLNGTHPDELLNGFVEAYRALGEAGDALAKAGPNGRDYYPQGHEAVTAAMEEHRVRLFTLQHIREEMLTLAEHVETVRPQPRA